MTIRVLTEADLREAVGLGAEELHAIEAVFPLITSGVGSMPPIMHIDVPEKNGEIDIKAAYLPGYSGIAVKVSAGFFDNPGQGLPSLGGLIVVFDVETGIPQAALFDNGYLTNLRTALAGAVAARHLANEDASTAAVFGAGVQARLQLEALTMVRDVRTALVWARRANQAELFARDMTSRLGIPVEVSPTREAAVAVADVLVTTTPSTEPLVEASMLHPGLHVTAMGSDAPTKQEVSSAALASADGVFCDSIQQSTRLGELRAAIAAGFGRERVVELGAVVAGNAPGRRTPGETTVCDLTGTGAQDTAISSLAVDRCVRSGAGIEVES